MPPFVAGTKISLWSTAAAAATCAMDATGSKADAYSSSGMPAHQEHSGKKQIARQQKKKAEITPDLSTAVGYTHAQARSHTRAAAALVVVTKGKV